MSTIMTFMDISFIQFVLPIIYIFIVSLQSCSASSQDYSRFQHWPHTQSYVKGYSMKIPQLKYMTNITNGDMNIIEVAARKKRGVAHLYNMLSCATGCNPLSYKGYGCYCGLLGSGFPVDGIDHCCKRHDWCYDVAKCPAIVEYFVPYYWKCHYRRPFCAKDHGELGAPGSCADMLCECDRALSECLKHYACPRKRAFCRSRPLRLFQNAFMLFT